MGFEFYAFDVLFLFFPIIIFTVIIFIMFINIKEYNRNKSSPILSERVRVITKRTEISATMHTNPDIHHIAHTDYYITFENESGQRFQLKVGPTDYGLISEGDYGIVTYQGKWFKKFERLYNY
ncbi:MAG: conserved domain protein histidine-rich [Caloramator sp.]|uniref:DUF2500 domain-containing protein n=1 Tax=Caloramator sp. TaxID=1871330 RepID=UPI001D2DD7FC|nr:DUF2500 domain-containing protein [Caloramator sp.]MBZ4663431.1 conserved domain protein histidine-rich [Caloramator sp.]